ncbi:uncharacterized protein LOC135473814 [Liolophura sinensis]|uniref:uncharacterized protein LOC135473814 n=1 Tax=Liolophura sinensis TaxID=3198878 RepID=UPI00315916D2
MSHRKLRVTESDHRLAVGALLKPEVLPTRSSISPTPRSLRGHTPSSVRFSDAAESHPYSSTFEDAPTETRTVSLWSDNFDSAVTCRTSYTDTFVSKSSVRASESQASLSRRSLQSLDDSSVGASYSDTFEATSSNQLSRTQDVSQLGYSLYSSEADRDSQSTVKSVIDSHRRLRTEDTQGSLVIRYDYTDSFETSDLSPSEEESETGLPTISEDDARYEFVRRLLDRLRGEKDEGLRKSAGSISQHSEKTESAKMLKANDVSTSSKYCKEKIKLLKRKKKYGMDCRKQKDSSPVEEKVSVTEYGFHPSIIEKLKTKSFMAAMEKASKAEIHEPRHCRDCRVVLEEIEEREQEKIFIRGKVADLQRKIMEDKICNHLVKMDSISLIADILQDLPRMSDSPAVISKRLNQPLTDHLDVLHRQTLHVPPEKSSSSTT